MSNALQAVAKRLSVSPDELQNIVMNTIMPNGGRGVTNEQFVSFMAVANEYKLNPLVKEIYAFPAKGGGIQPIVSIDGWLKIINSHAQFDGMEHEDITDSNGNLTAIKCAIFRKDTRKPITVTEYMAECRGQSEPWKKWPARMLRHKATIQAGRYAFGISGIIDPDEADRFSEVNVIDKGQAVREEAAPVEYITEEQAEVIRELIKNYDGNETLFCQGASIGCVEELKAHRFEGAKRNLERKIARMIAADQAKSEQQGAA